MGIDGNIKMAALYLWTSIVDIGNKMRDQNNNSSIIEGPNLTKGLNWISQQLASPDLVNKEMGMTLLCRSKYIYVRFLRLKSGLSDLV